MEVLSSSASVWFLKFLFPLLGGSFWRRFWMDESDSGEPWKLPTFLYWRVDECHNSSCRCKGFTLHWPFLYREMTQRCSKVSHMCANVQ